MNDKNRNTIIVVIAVVLAIYLVANPQQLYGALGTLHTLAAITFYAVAVVWLLKHM